MTVSDTFTCTMEAEMWVFGALNTKVVRLAKKNLNAKMVLRQNIAIVA